jgi:hypothetical protein
MDESGHSEPCSREEMRSALRRLEEALARHERQLAPVAQDASNLPLQVLRRSVAVMREEADRLRSLLADG